MSREGLWTIPVALNVATVAGLAWALLAEGWLGKAMAVATMALPLCIACYYAVRRPRDR
jgi:hypothetical protein